MRRLELHRTVMEEHGDGAKPVWITELGWRTSAPDPADRWQTVTLAQQRDYTLRAIELAAGYPWLERLAFWELNSGVDNHGYALWQGADRTTPAYDALAARSAPVTTAQTRREILAPDVAIRLGDRSELHPHWVHLHRGGEHFSPDWRGEFYLDDEQAATSNVLVLETMQVDQPTNRVLINGEDVGRLRPRTRPDPASTWSTQRLDLLAGVLRPGVNDITIVAGPRNPARIYRWWRWENFQFRNVRLEATTLPVAEGTWQPLPSPAGWSETIRLRRGADDGGGRPTIWLMGNRPGQIWRGVLEQETMAALTLTPATGNRPDLVFNDVADDGRTQVAATDGGLFWRSGGGWRPARGAPAVYAHVVRHDAGTWYAGFADLGLWAASAPAGPWQPLDLEGRSVLDAVVARGALAAATDSGVFVRSESGWTRLPALPAAARGPAAANFTPRLFVGAAGELFVRSEDRLFRWDRTGGAWQIFGPPALQGKLRFLAECCAPGALAGADRNGLWQLQPDFAWERVDGAVLDELELTDGLLVAERLLLATANGIFTADAAARLDDPATWQRPDGLPATVTALLVDPADATRWLAGTPVGVYRTQDAGATWHAISPPWVVWDMAFGEDGRLFVARADGIAWTDDLAAHAVSLHETTDLENVTFFTVSPDPTDAAGLWAGTWGNDIGVSSDGGATLTRLGNGLETLSVLAILRHPTPGQFTVGTIEGLYRSDDGGKSWFGLPGPLARQTVYALLHGDDGVLWAGAADGLWSSRDYGATWERVGALPTTTVIRLGKVAMSDAQWLWAGTEDAGVWWSRDQGTTWRFGGLPGRSVYALQAQDGSLLAATDRGLFKDEPFSYTHRSGTSQ